MKIFATLLLLCVGCLAQDPPAPTSGCVATSFTGNVKRALPFVQVIGDGLTYRLAPKRQAAATESEQAQFIGWTIEVAYLRQKGEMEREFSWVMTPPYKQWNARELNTSFGRTVADVLKADHTIYFPLDSFDYAEADKAVKRILWRSSPSEFQESARELRRIPVGSAKLTIVDSQLGGEKTAPTSMESLYFKVELTIPASVKLTPELARRAKPAACPVSPVIHMLKEMEQ
jgi:hypothetical protein